MAPVTIEEFLELQSQTKRAYEILINGLNKRSVKFKMVEAFIYPDIKTVGVKGDQRVYAYPLFVTVHMSKRRLYLDYDFLREVSTKITNECHDIVRVVYRLRGNANLSPSQHLPGLEGCLVLTSDKK